MKLTALALAILAPAFGRTVHSVTIAGELRVILPTAYENVSPFMRLFRRGQPPFVDYSAHVQAATDAAFTNVVLDETLAGRLYLKGGLPPVVLPFDGTFDYAGTSGFVMLDVFSMDVSEAFTTTSSQLFWRIADDSATVTPGALQIVETGLGVIDTSRLVVTGI